MSKRKPRKPPTAISAATHKGQLGLPTIERVQHYPDGYETHQLATGYDRDGGVIQSRERAILTHPALLAELYNALVQQHREAGEELPQRVEIKQTPGDRATAGQRGILWGYISVHLSVLRGEISVANYEGSIKSSDIYRIPKVLDIEKKKFDHRRFYAWIREQTGFAVVTNFLDQVAAHDNPGLVYDADTILKKHDIGRNLLGKELVCGHCSMIAEVPTPTHCRHCGAPLHVRDRDAENAFYGALSLASLALAEAARDFFTIETRHRGAISFYPLAP